MPKLLTTLLASTSLLLAACSWLPGVHKLDIQQGNVLNQDMLDKLKPGMDKSQVRFALGTPPLVDVFHQERWDYVYSIQEGSGDRRQRHIVLFFDKNDKLERIKGDVTPAAGKRKEQAPQETAVTVPPSKPEKGLFGKLKSAVGLGKEDDLIPTPSNAKETPAPASQSSTDLSPESAEAPSL